MLRHILTLLLLTGFSLCAAAQEEEHYTKEFGVAVGGNFMLNDVNAKPYGGTHFSGGLLLRFLLNPRMAVKVGASYNNIKGETSGVADFYPADPSTSGNERLEKAFSGGITDLSATYELNFLPYGYLRWIAGREADPREMTLTSDTKWVQDLRGNNLLLFASEWNIQWALERNEGLQLTEFNRE